MIIICLPLLLCDQVGAQHSGPYVGAFIGGNALMNAKGSDNQGEFSLAFAPSLLGSAVLGWDFEPGNPKGEGRVEVEFTRRSNPLDQVKFVEGSFAGGGKVTADSLLLNFFAVLHDSSRWSPYAGVGIGAARIYAANMTVTGSPLINGSAYVFAYQAGGGIDFALNKHLNLDLGYRYFGSNRPGFTEANGQKVRMDYLCHSLILGMRVGF